MKLIPEEIREFIEYDPETGVLTWLKSCGRVKAGREAATSGDYGYKKLVFRGKSYLAHRLAWFLSTGSQPNHIDHIDGNRSNNLINNLRNIKPEENNFNRPSHRRGNPLGVDFVRGKWRARKLRSMMFVNEPRALGWFTSKEEAGKVVDQWVKNRKKGLFPRF